jgi:RNA polymerase sigma factor (sigma-70 family)
MASGSLSQVIRRTLFRVQGDGTSDGELLERFVGRRDGAAFEELVRRHGPMVLRVCRRVLPRLADAEDAFQATFIVLARKAGSIVKRASLASWLHGVAHRVALQAREREQRHQDTRAPELTETVADGCQREPATEVAWRDLRPVLDEEVGRLPEKYRAPLVLCYLEGRTTDETAAQLGWPRGTVASYLSRARDLLRERLARRGLTLSGATLAALLSQEAVSAAVPAPLAASALPAAMPSVGAQTPSAFAERAAPLAEAVVRGMVPSKPKIAAAIVLGLCVFAAGAFILLPKNSVAPDSSPAKTPDTVVSTEPPPPADPGKHVYLHWDPLLRKFVHTIHHPVEEPWGDARSAVWSHDGKLLAVGYQGGAVALSDRANGNQGTVHGRSALKAPHCNLPVTKLAFSPDGKTLATLAGTESEGALLFWDVSSRAVAGKPVNWRQATTRWTNEAKLVFTPDGKTLIHYLGINDVHFWDVGTAMCKSFLMPRDCVCLAVSPDGTSLGLFRHTTDEFLAWDLATQQERRLCHVDRKGQACKVSAALSSQGRRAAVELAWDDQVRVIVVDAASNKWRLLTGLDWTTWPSYSLQISPDGSVLLRTGRVREQLAEYRIPDNW